MQGQIGVAKRNLARWSYSLAPISCIIAMGLAAHPYAGIIHDSRFYMLQALHALDPAPWRQDIYFRFGTQDSFTLFTPLFKYPVSWLGPAGAQLVAAIVGDAAWIAALLWVCATLFERRAEFWIAIAAAVVLNGKYGGSGIVSYAEAFATPRLFGEALALASLGAALRGRMAIALALTVASAIVHPLMALGAAGVIFFGAAQVDRRTWALGMLGALAALTACALGIGPLKGLWTTYDPAWWDIVHARFPFALVSEWTGWDDLRVVANVAALLALLSLATVRERRILRAVLAVALLSIAGSLAASEGLKDVLLTGLQFWRALWLVTLAANVAIGLLAARLAGPARWLVVAGAALDAGGRFFPAMGAVGALLLLCSCFLVGAQQTSLLRQGGVRAVRVIVLVVGAVALAATPRVLAFEVKGDTNAVLHAAQLTIAAASVAGLLLWLIRPRAMSLLPVGAALLVASAATADQRTAWTRYVYGAGSDGGLAGFLAKAGETYWEGDDGVDALWFKRRQSSYSSCMQGTEGIFFRGNAMESARRSAALRPLNTAEFRNYPCGTSAVPTQKGPTARAQLVAACRALPDLDTLILNRPVPGVAIRSWRAPVSQTVTDKDGSVTRTSTFYRYDCATLR